MELEPTTLRLVNPRLARVEAIVFELRQIRESAADPLYGRGAAPYGFGGGDGGGGAGGGAGGGGGGGAAPKPAPKPPAAKAPAPKPNTPAPGAK